MNRPLLLAAAFAAGVAIGGAASWPVLDDGGGPEAPRVPPAALPAAPFQAAPAPPPAPVRPASRGAPEPIAARSFRDVTGGVEEFAQGPVVGKGRISGTVRTDPGQPLAGVVVRAGYSGDDEGQGGGRDWKSGDGPVSGGAR
jgi:hypothetical protein